MFIRYIWKVMPNVLVDIFLSYSFSCPALSRFDYPHRQDEQASSGNKNGTHGISRHNSHVLFLDQKDRWQEAGSVCVCR